MSAEHSAIDDLASVLDGLARVREAAADPRALKVIMFPKPVYPMSLPAVQLAINPFEIFLLLALFVSGLAFVIVGVATPASVQKLLPPVWSVVWSLNVAIGSGLALFGGLWRRQMDRGLLLYQLGWGLAGIGAFIYGLAVLLNVSSAGLYTSMINLFLSLACVIRVIQVSRIFKIAEMLMAHELQLPIVPVVPEPGGDDSDGGGGPGF